MKIQVHRCVSGSYRGYTHKWGAQTWQAIPGTATMDCKGQKYFLEKIIKENCDRVTDFEIKALPE
jgi:hypothetical protein